LGELRTKAASQFLKLGNAGQPNAAGIDVGARGLGGAGGEKKEMIGGTCTSVTGESKGRSSKRCNSARKRHSGDYAMGSLADWTERRGGDLRGKAGRHGVIPRF
jgi:hypothetical protein